MLTVETTETFDAWLAGLRDRRGARLIVLLCGGDKSSQSRDIVRAKAFEREL